VLTRLCTANGSSPTASLPLVAAGAPRVPFAFHHQHPSSCPSARSCPPS